MTKEQLKALGLAEEVVAQIVEDYGKNYVSKEQFNAKNEELKALKEERKKMTEELESLRTTNADNGALQKQIAELQKKQSERENEFQETLKQMNAERIISLALVNAKAKNEKCVKALLNLENVEVEGDTIKGLSEQLEAIKKDNPFLFEETEKASITGFTPSDTPKAQGGITQEQFRKMSYAEKLYLYDNNKELFEQLSE